MSAITTITSLMPLVKQAADVIAAFRGDAQQASSDTKIADAVEVLTAGAQLAESFSRGIEITPDDVRVALANMDEKIAAFDAEIARQEQNP